MKLCHNNTTRFTYKACHKTNVSFYFVYIEQDRGLDAISAALRRQQKVGLAIQDEVSEHNGERRNKMEILCCCFSID